MTPSTNPAESNESASREILVDMPEALLTAANIEAKRLGVSLEQWVAEVVSHVLAAE